MSEFGQKAAALKRFPENFGEQAKAAARESERAYLGSVAPKRMVSKLAIKIDKSKSCTNRNALARLAGRAK